ncbi:MAG: serine hydrolase [Candidatus Sacchiramonaceae bacterium]|nr:serine hydrolase [Candidatus Saccharimonadaceae bacterium]
MVQKIKKLFRRIVDFFAKHRKKIFIGIACLLLVVILVQVFWPKNYSLPFSRVRSDKIGVIDRGQVQEILENQFSESKIIIETNVNSEASFKGESILNNGTINESWLDAEMEYPLVWRFVPFSFYFFRANIQAVDLDIDESKLDNLAEEKAKDLSREPKNAVFEVDGEKINIKPSEDGVKVGSDTVKDAIKNYDFKLSDNRISVDGEKIIPEIITSNYEPLRDKAENAISKDIYFMVPIGNRLDKFATSAKERASLLDVVKTDDGEFVLTLKDDEMSKLFGVLEEKVRKEPGVTVVKTINGEEVGRTAGIEGWGLNFEDYKDQIFSKIFDDDSGVEIELKLKSIPPVVRYEREFTNSNKGLQSYLDEATRGKNISISVQQLSGEFWSAESNGDKRMTSASTYKLFMAQFIMNKIDNGQLSWGSSALGTNVDGCMYNMIVRSANDCPEYWLSVYGRNSINNYLQSVGYESVFSNSGQVASTTANSLRKMLTNLYFGDNFSAGNANKLRGLMSSQIYRQGIPAGTPNQVADKVGFLGGVLNDAGIVYHPKGNYVLVVMTDGESWEKIAEITREVERIMYG